MKNMAHLGSEFSLFVGDLPLDCSDDKLQRLFQQKFKSVKRVQSKYIPFQYIKHALLYFSRKFSLII